MRNSPILCSHVRMGSCQDVQACTFQSSLSGHEKIGILPLPQITLVFNHEVGLDALQHVTRGPGSARCSNAPPETLERVEEIYSKQVGHDPPFLKAPLNVHRKSPVHAFMWSTEGFYDEDLVVYATATCLSVRCNK